MSGGTIPGDNTRGAVYRWKYGSYTNNGNNNRYARRQFREPTAASRLDLERFVKRFYQQILNRDAEEAGLNYWVSSLSSGQRAGADLAVGFIFSQEFTNRNTSNDIYLTILYKAFFDREPDAGGWSTWLQGLNSGASRLTVLNGFIYLEEFANLTKRYNIKAF